MTNENDLIWRGEDWIAWLDDLPLPIEYHDGFERLQAFIGEAIALPAAKVGVKVKPLVWRRADLSAWGEYADAGVVRYRMTWTYRNEPEVWFVMRCEHDGKTLYEGGDEDAAIAAANADCAARVLAALTPQPAPTLADALELPEIRALVDAARPFSQVTIRNGVSGAGQIGRTDVTNIRAALAALQTKGGA